MGSDHVVGVTLPLWLEAYTWMKESRNLSGSVFSFLNRVTCQAGGLVRVKGVFGGWPA